MKKNNYKKPATVIIEVKPQRLMSGSQVPKSKANEESLDDYDVQDLQTW